MSTPRFDLVDVVQTLRRRFGLIVIITIVTALLGALSYFFGKKEYKAKASFLMANPVYTDRNNIFQDRQIQFVDYFAGDNDVDRLVTLAESDTVRFLVAERLNLAQAYALDVSKPKEAEKLKNIVKDNLKVDRSEYNNLDISYVDTDPARAAAVVNATVKAIEELFRDYYVSQRMENIRALDNKIVEMDSTINSLTDSLAGIRDEYKIYDLISPSRQNAVMRPGAGGPGYGRAIEVVQNFEAIKDQLVSDRAMYTSLRHQYATTIDTKNMALLHMLYTARVPVKPKPPGLILTTIGAAFLGFFFAAIYVLIITYYRLLISVER